MSNHKIATVITPGFLSTIQDMGRQGFQAFGVPEAGAMDREAALIANLLVSNRENAPLIEITVMGLEMEFAAEATIAVTGGNLNLQVDNVPQPMYQTLSIKPGSRIKFAGVKKGARAYLAIAGEMNIPLVMGSFSTYLRGEIGGMKGRKLEKDDIIEGKTKYVSYKALDDSLIRDYGNKVIRVVINRDEDYFTGEGINTFLTSEYTISSQSDRMGYRMEGPEITHRKGADIISTAINFGAIQVPGHGQPIVMMADRQTVGGYTQIGRVITNDLPYLAQMFPGEKVSFKEVSIREAQNIYRDRISILRKALV
jgi:antagonist of KipI